MADDSKQAGIAVRDALMRNDRADVVSAVRDAVAGDAPLGKQWPAMAQAVQHSGEHSLALKCIERWMIQDGPTPALSLALATTLARAGRTVDAAAVMDDMAAGSVDLAAWNYTRGTLSLNLGKIEEAKTLLRQSIQQNPRSGQAWLALSMAGKISPADGNAMETVAPSFASGTDIEAGAFHYARSRYFEQNLWEEEAFADVARGAAIISRLRPYDRAEDDALTDRLIAEWDRPAIDRISGRLGAPAGTPPIFVTGLPRSGTTLVEQILASHSAVDGGDELGLLRWSIEQLGGFGIGGFDAASPDALRSARSLFLRLVTERFPGGGRVVDKTLALSRSMGAVAALLPDAPIVWLRRDPLDSAWSVYRTFFLRSVDWGWTEDSIAAFFRNEDRLFDHWTRVLGDRILVVPYEELATDPAPWRERITRFCSLEPEAAQSAAHLHERTVTTASVAQVRQPIHTNSIGSGARYARRMTTFIERYRPV